MRCGVRQLQWTRLVHTHRSVCAYLPYVSHLPYLLHLP